MFNKVILLGNLTRDVELRYLNTGSPVATFGLASNRRYKRQDGTQVDDTCFIDITLFGRTAEIANQYLKKGSKVLIEGRLNFETWNDQQGNKRSKHNVIAETLQMLDSKPQGEYSQHDSNGGTSRYENYQQNPDYQHNQNTNAYSSNSYNTQNSNVKKGSYQEPPEIDIDEEIPF